MPRNIFLTLLAFLFFATIAKAEDMDGLGSISLGPGYYVIEKSGKIDSISLINVDVKQDFKKGREGWRRYTIDGFKDEKNPVSFTDSGLCFIVYEERVKRMDPSVFKLGELEYDEFFQLWRLKRDIPLSAEVVKGTTGKVYALKPAQLSLGKRYVFYFGDMLYSVGVSAEWDPDRPAMAYYFAIK